MQQQTQQSQQVPPLAPMGSLTPTLGLGMGMSIGQPKYGFAMPITTMQPQTPVNKFQQNPIKLYNSIFLATFNDVPYGQFRGINHFCCYTKYGTGNSIPNDPNDAPFHGSWHCSTITVRYSNDLIDFILPHNEFYSYFRNIVSTVNLNCKLDLKKIALHARNAEYNPKRFAAVIMRIREPRTTALIFSSGKMVCTGAKSEEDSRLAARKYARIIQKLGFPAKFLDFKIQNMVGSCDVKFPIRLEGLVLTHSAFSSYEPELFPGLIYRMVKPRIVLLIFVSGKVVLTGAKVRQEIYEAFDNIYPILKSFKKQ